MTVFYISHNNITLCKRTFVLIYICPCVCVCMCVALNVKKTLGRRPCPNHLISIKYCILLLILLLLLYDIWLPYVGCNNLRKPNGRELFSGYRRSSPFPWEGEDYDCRHRQPATPNELGADPGVPFIEELRHKSSTTTMIHAKFNARATGRRRNTQANRVRPPLSTISYVRT